MKKTYKELQEVDIMVGQLYSDHPELKDSKFGYAYKRFADKNFYAQLKKLNQELLDARIDHALEDPDTKAILKDPTDARGFKYSKEGLKKIIQAEIKISDKWENKEIDIEPYICQDIPEQISDELIGKLEGLLIASPKKKKV